MFKTSKFFKRGYVNTAKSIIAYIVSLLRLQSLNEHKQNVDAVETERQKGQIRGMG